MSHNRLTSQKLFERIGPLANAANTPLVDLSAPKEIKINIRPDKKVALSLFEADPLLPGGWVAHPDTIRAMRKDLFVVGDGLEDLEIKYECTCGKILDAQFWESCPFCGASINITF